MAGAGQAGKNSAQGAARTRDPAHACRGGGSPEPAVRAAGAYTAGMAGMENPEEKLRREILTGYAVEAARDYAAWLETQDRLEEALVILEAALREGPDFGSHGELSSVSLLDDLETAWGRIGRKLGRTLPSGGRLYNEGLANPPHTVWQDVLARAEQAAAGRG